VLAIWRLVMAISFWVFAIYSVVIPIYRRVHRDLLDVTGDL
jgi:hypothetical protein